MQEWAHSMHRLLSPNGYLLIISCCFDSVEVKTALDASDSMFAEGMHFQLESEDGYIQDGQTSRMSILLFKKVSCSTEEPESSHAQEDPSVERTLRAVSR